MVLKWIDDSTVNRNMKMNFYHQRMKVNIIWWQNAFNWAAAIQLLRHSTNKNSFLLYCDSAFKFLIVYEFQCELAFIFHFFINKLGSFTWKEFLVRFYEKKLVLLH